VDLVVAPVDAVDSHVKRRVEVPRYGGIGVVVVRRTNDELGTGVAQQLPDRRLKARLVRQEHGHRRLRPDDDLRAQARGRLRR
jgi:hypothetical protein